MFSLRLCAVTTTSVMPVAAGASSAASAAEAGGAASIAATARAQFLFGLILRAPPVVLLNALAIRCRRELHGCYTPCILLTTKAYASRAVNASANAPLFLHS